MARDLHEFLARDHERLDALLRACLQGNHESYAEFRGGLLRHISIEERVWRDEHWRGKVQSDIKKIAETNRGYVKAIFVSSRFIKDRDRSQVEDDLTKKHNIQVQIHDASENDRRAAASRSSMGRRHVCIGDRATIASRGSSIFHGGADARWMLHNATLDGGLFHDGPPVARRDFVHDLRAGFSFRVFRNFRATYTLVRRGEEFTPPPGRDGGPHNYNVLFIAWEPQR